MYLMRISPTVAERASAGRVSRFAGERTGAPIARTHQILCIGLNYRDPPAETGQAVPDECIDSLGSQRPAYALERVEPAGRVVYVGLAGSPSLIDTRTLALKDVTAVGILSASPGLDATIEAFASGAIDPRPLVAATVCLDQVSDVLAGGRPGGAGPGPKVHVDPRMLRVGSS